MLYELFTGATGWFAILWIGHFCRSFRSLPFAVGANLQWVAALHLLEGVVKQNPSFCHGHWEKLGFVPQSAGVVAWAKVALFFGQHITMPIRD